MKHMKHIKLFETWHSDLPQTMKMEDIKKLSPDDFLKLAEETLERGKDTDQNEFWTIWGTWSEANRALVDKDTRFLGKLGDLSYAYDLQSDDDHILYLKTLPPVMGNKKKEELEKEIERVESYIKNIKERPDKIEAMYKYEINKLDRRKKDGMDQAMRKLKKLPELEKELAELKSEREKIKF